jgi:hypothetical protein
MTPQKITYRIPCACGLSRWLADTHAPAVCHAADSFLKSKTSSGIRSAHKSVFQRRATDDQCLHHGSDVASGPCIDRASHVRLRRRRSSLASNSFGDDRKCRITCNGRIPNFQQHGHPNAASYHSDSTGFKPAGDFAEPWVEHIHIG